MELNLVWKSNDSILIKTTDGRTFKFIRRYDTVTGTATNDFYLAECGNFGSRQQRQITNIFDKDFANKLWYNMQKNPTDAATMLENISREGIDVIFYD